MHSYILYREYLLTDHLLMHALFQLKAIGNLMSFFLLEIPTNINPQLSCIEC
jgi:hypothetical protein